MTIPNDAAHAIGPPFPDARGGRPQVIVVGGGVAGLAAAHRLIERGHDVALLEANAFLGGKLGAHREQDEYLDSKREREADAAGTFGQSRCPGCPGPGAEGCEAPRRAADWHEHCYHMYLNWYGNFWDLMADIGARGHFAPVPDLHYLPPDPRAPYGVRTNPGSPWTMLQNVGSDVASPADAVVNAQLLADLLAQPATPGGALETTSVRGFLGGRPYATRPAAELAYLTLAKAFAARSYLSSARSFQALVKYGARLPEPTMWLLRGNTQEALFTPWLVALARLSGRFRIRWPADYPPRPAFAAALAAAGAAGQEGSDARPSFTLFPLVSVGRIAFDEATATLRMHVTRNACSPAVLPGQAPATTAAEVWEHRGPVILAVPPGQLGSLAYSTVSGQRGEGELSLADADRALADVVRLRTEPLMSLDLFFRRTLERPVPPGHPRTLPPGITLLTDSRYALSFLDLSQAWEDGAGSAGRTVLNVVASDPHTLIPYTTMPGGSRLVVGRILDELRRYLPFDPETDILHCRTHLQTNVGAELFVNEVGSWQWRPQATTTLPNLWVAGDFCRTPVDVVTIEGAVTSGLIAAEAVRRSTGLGTPIPIRVPDSYPVAAMAAAAAATRPGAWTAKAVATADAAVKANYRALFPDDS